MPPVVAFLSCLGICTLLVSASFLLDPPLAAYLGAGGLLVGLLGVGVLVWHNTKPSRRR